MSVLLAMSSKPLTLIPLEGRTLLAAASTEEASVSWTGWLGGQLAAFIIPTIVTAVTSKAMTHQALWSPYAKEARVTAVGMGFVALSEVLAEAAYQSISGDAGLVYMGPITGTILGLWSVNGVFGVEKPIA